LLLGREAVGGARPLLLMAAALLVLLRVPLGLGMALFGAAQLRAALRLALPRLLLLRLLLLLRPR
jgi:hypothetical protein